MSNINIHIYPSTMTNESRMFKESKFISSLNRFDKIILFGVSGDGLEKEENYYDNIFIKRINILNIKSRIVQYLYYYLYLFMFIVIRKPKQVNIHTLEFLPFALLSKLFRLKVIYDTHELETQKNNVRGFRKKVSKIIEKSFIRFVDKVIVVGEAIADEYKKLYPYMEKPAVVLNCPNYKLVENKYNIFREKFDLSDDTIIFLYQGEFGLGRNIEKLIESFSKITDPKKVIVFMGFGSLENKVIEASQKNKNIFFHEAVTPDVLLRYTSSADIGISAIENTSKSYNYCMPNKMFEYIMANLPIIVTDLYEMSNFVNKNNVGFILKNDSKEEIVSLVNSITLESLVLFKSNIKEVKLKYNWEEQKKVLKKVYKDI